MEISKENRKILELLARDHSYETAGGFVASSCLFVL